MIGVTIRWLGQAGFLLSAAGGRVLVDPWFSDHELRRFPPAALDALPWPIDLLLATHGHEDHLDLGSLPAVIQRSPGLEVVVPEPLVERVRASAPSAAVRGVQPGSKVSMGDLTVRAVPAWHGVTAADGYGPGPFGAAPHVGYVITFPELIFFHAGDTVPAKEIVEALDGEAVDVALLPINGRDAVREAAGILGNLDPAEAVRLAVDAWAWLLIPMHYDMVEGNTEDPGAAVRAAVELAAPLHVLVPSRDADITLGSRTER